MLEQWRASDTGKNITRTMSLTLTRTLTLTLTLTMSLSLTLTLTLPLTLNLILTLNLTLTPSVSVLEERSLGQGGGTRVQGSSLLLEARVLGSRLQGGGERWLHVRWSPEN